MSIRRGTAPKQTVDSMLADAVSAANVHDPLGEGNGYTTASVDNPLHRDLVVSIRASLNDLCLQKSKAHWQPTAEALQRTFQQRKFTSLDGATQAVGDLKTAVLHNLEIKHSKSTFPMALGASVTLVDNQTFSSTGDDFSTILLPQSENSNVRQLQADDVSLAYEFSKKFPGYTSANLADKGIHEVSQRRFVLVAADHPIVSAISENADKLQMGEISMMPEGLVKISSSLYESILPLVRTQVESQIKVRDLSKTAVFIQPAEYSSWQEARNALLMDAKKQIKAERAAKLQAVPEDAKEAIHKEFNEKELSIEHSIDHKQLDVHLQIGCDYNFLSS